MFRTLATPIAAIIIVLAAWYGEVVVRVQDPPGPVVVTYWEKWTSFEGDAMRAVVDAFNRKQKRVFVKLLTVSGIENKTLMAVAGGNPPDVAGPVRSQRGAIRRCQGDHAPR